MRVILSASIGAPSGVRGRGEGLSLLFGLCGWSWRVSLVGVSHRWECLVVFGLGRFGWVWLLGGGGGWCFVGFCGAGLFVRLARFKLRVGVGGV